MDAQVTLEGKNVVITGAGRGLGAAYARAAAGLGARVVVNDVNDVSAEAVVDEITHAGGVASAFPTSVTEWDGAQQLVAHCESEFGPIDGLVNNAAVFNSSPAWDETEASLRRIVDVNIMGVLFCGTAALQRMVSHRRGSIVNIASRSLGGLPGDNAAYGVTKGAVASATWCWATEARPHGVRVNCLLPSAETPATDEMRSLGHDVPIGRDGPPEDVAGAVAYLLSDRSAGVTGQLVRMHQRILGLLSPLRFVDSVAVDDVDADTIAQAFDEHLMSALQPYSFTQDEYPTP